MACNRPREAGETSIYGFSRVLNSFLGSNLNLKHWGPQTPPPTIQILVIRVWVISAHRRFFQNRLRPSRNNCHKKKLKKFSGGSKSYMGQR